MGFRFPRIILIILLIFGTQVSCKDIRRLTLKKNKYLTRFILCNNTSEDLQIPYPYTYFTDCEECRIRSVKELKNDTLFFKILTDIKYYAKINEDFWKDSKDKRNISRVDWPKGKCDDYYLDIHSNEKEIIIRSDELTILLEVDNEITCFKLDLSAYREEWPSTPQQLFICQ